MSLLHDELKDEIPQLTEVETLCMNCMENGMTRLLLARIPHFREVIIASFECPHCGHTNREVQSGASLAEKGVRHILTVSKRSDLDRKIIKSDSCSVEIPELELEIPPNTQKGVCSTLEGMISDAVAGLSLSQEHRREVSPEIAEKLQKIIDRLKLFAAGEELPFTFIVDDPAGNSFIEYEGLSPALDTSINSTQYQRTKQQLHAMGFYEENANLEEQATPDPLDKAAPHTAHLGEHLPNQLKSSGWDLGVSIEENIVRYNKRTEQDSTPATSESEQEGIIFYVECPHCGKQGANEMCQIDIPGFRRCIIMSFNCLNCGSRSNEVKAMGAYGDRAKKWILKVTTAEDLNRDVLKSDTAAVSIPELEFEMSMGTLGGVFTTVEGLLMKTVESLEGTGDMFAGDSADIAKKHLFSALIEKLRSLAMDESSLPFTLILDDPADLSMISDRYTEHRNPAPEHEQRNDPNLITEIYDRTDSQNEELGLADMKTEGYEED